jgi:Rha family phage regulatory protein
MNQKQIQIIKQQFTIRDGKPVTTSVKVAEVFQKEHKNVLRDIEQLTCSPEFHRLNFEPISYRDHYNREQRAFTMTKDGFWRLGFGYQDRKGNHLAELYIAAFNLMEAELASGMAKTRGELTMALLGVVFEAAKAGRPADFIPELVRYKSIGLKQDEIGRLLNASRRTVSYWMTKLKRAGVKIEKRKRPNTELPGFAKDLEAAQLSLFSAMVDCGWDGGNA